MMERLGRTVYNDLRLAAVLLLEEKLFIIEFHVSL